MLIYQEKDPVTFICGLFRKRYLSHQSLRLWKISKGQCVNSFWPSCIFGRLRYTHVEKHFILVIKTCSVPEPNANLLSTEHSGTKFNHETKIFIQQNISENVTYKWWPFYSGLNVVSKLIIPVDTWRIDNVIITSKRRYVVLTQKWRQYYVMCLLKCYNEPGLSYGQCLPADINGTRDKTVCIYYHIWEHNSTQHSLHFKRSQPSP